MSVTSLPIMVAPIVYEDNVLQFAVFQPANFDGFLGSAKCEPIAIYAEPNHVIGYSGRAVDRGLRFTSRKILAEKGKKDWKLDLQQVVALVVLR
jgi:hypothetical protein